MQLTERRSEGLLRVYDVLVPASELQQKLAAKIAEVQPRVRINGFRPGKVPVAHIRKVYGAGMMQDIINETVQKSTQEGLEKVNARPASEPSLDLKSDMGQVMAGNADLQFELSPHGATLKAQGVSVDNLLRTPRAVEYILVTLVRRGYRGLPGAEQPRTD